MKKQFRLILSAILILFLQKCPATDGFKILGICPSASYSHQKPFQELMKALAARGHEVTVISTIPQKKPVKNYRDIDVSFTYRRKDCSGLRHMNAFELLHKNMREANDLCEEQLSSSVVQQFIRLENETFDSIIIEQLWYNCYYSLVKRYDFPVLIGFLSVGNLPYVMDSVGNPDDPLLNPDMAYPFTSEMKIHERIMNLLYTSWTRIYYNFWHLPRAAEVASRYVGETPVSQIDRNYSLVILGNNHVFGYPKPLLPNVVEVHSLQIAENPGSLPKDILDFLDDAKEGVVYFSLGSNLKTDQLAERTLHALCNALNSLKQRVLWKHDGPIPISAGNIKLVKWVPQQAVLAHPNVRLYIMQGGLQSLQEAVHYSVPVIVLPFFGDQHFNARKVLDAELGLTLDIDTLTNETLVNAIVKVVNDEKYRKNIALLSRIIKDEQVKPLDKAIWHIEHVLKFPHAEHLRYRGHYITRTEYYATYLLVCSLICVIISICCIALRYAMTYGRDVIRRSHSPWHKKNN